MPLRTPEPGTFEHLLPTHDVTSRHIVTLQRPTRPTLVLADLRGKALKKLGLNNDISASDDYTASMAWAQAIHNCSPTWDGLLYVSRQHNDRTAVALFQRSGVSVARKTRLSGKRLDDLCDEYGVVLV